MYSPLPSPFLIILLLLSHSNAAKTTPSPPPLYDFPPITCPELPTYPYRVIHQALIFYGFNIQQAVVATAQGAGYAPLKAIFKVSTFPNPIFGKILSMGLLDRPTPTGRQPHIKCARTQAEAAQYNNYVPDLWAKCSNPDHLVSAVSSVREHEGEDILFLCPEFWNLPNQFPMDPTPEFCPGVRDNMFVDSPGRLRMGRTESAVFTAFAAEVYIGGQAVYPIWQDYLQRLNEAVGWDAERAVGEPWSFQVFVELATNRCQNAPDVDQAPWNTLARHGSNGVVNATVNATLALDVVQSSASPISLVQGHPPDIVGTS